MRNCFLLSDIRRNLKTSDASCWHRLKKYENFYHEVRSDFEASRNGIIIRNAF